MAGGKNTVTIETVNFVFDEPNPGLSESRLNAIEVNLGGALDQDYRSFLKKINGGRPNPELVSRYLEYPIVLFLGWDEGKSNLLQDYEHLRMSIGRDDLLPIAYDSSMSRICLTIGRSQSAVFVVSIDELYQREPTKITTICNSFMELWGALLQPPSSVNRLEALAVRPWSEIQKQVESDERLLKSENEELSLLCQVIRAANAEAFFGLVARGASLDGALKVAIANKHFDFVKKLVESGANAVEGIPYAVGPSRKAIREYLVKQSR